MRNEEVDECDVIFNPQREPGLIVNQSKSFDQTELRKLNGHFRTKSQSYKINIVLERPNESKFPVLQYVLNFVNILIAFFS